MHNPVIVLAPDSFKGSMSAKEVCDAMERGIHRVLPHAECIKVPMADGGEGTVRSLVDATGGVTFEQKVTGPLGEPVLAEYGILADGKTAVIEMASAGGLCLVDKDLRNPLITTTYGVGELVKVCLDKGINRIILGIGGSATNDGGAGFVQALGVRFLDKDGYDLPFGGAILRDLYSIDISSIDKRIKSVDIEVACDVNNPLCGIEGASYIFAPQKGATSAMVEILDKALSHYGEILEIQLGKDIKDVPGAGAAGGLGAGLLAFTNATLRSGIDIVIEYTNLREKIRKADIVFTGEGSMDNQTLYGKVPLGVALLAKEESRKCIAITGNISGNIKRLYDFGIDAVFSIIPHVMPIEEALAKGEENIECVMENIMRLLVKGMK